MATNMKEDEEDDDDDLDIGEGFRAQLDALKRACMISVPSQGVIDSVSDPSSPSSTLEEDDDELLQSLRKRYAFCSRVPSDFPAGAKLSEIHCDEEDDDEADDAILRSVEQLYAASDNSKLPCESEVLNGQVVASETKREGGKELTEYNVENDEDESAEISSHQDLGRTVSTFLPSNWNEVEVSEGATCSPPSVASILDSYQQPRELLSSADCRNLSSSDQLKHMKAALRKNQSLQEKMRTILSRVELKQRQNAEMLRRVQSLVDFEKYCKRRCAGFFTDQTNPSVQIFSARVERREGSDKGDEPFTGPFDNPDVEVYRKLKQKAMATYVGKSWRAEERMELAKGVKQQVYEVLVCEAMDAVSNGNLTGESALDDALKEIQFKDLSPQDIHGVVAGVSWDEIARLYVVNRTAEECRIRWFNHEDSLINKAPWTKLEDKKLLSIVHMNSATNWEKIAEELGTRRTPSHCLIRYQRSLNAGIMRSNWTSEEDDKLKAAVEKLGESDWNAIAACLEGRNNSQCLMRWRKVLHPDRHRKGRWSVEEDKRLKWAVSVYGAKKWKHIAEHVPGRTDIQVRERWCNVLNPDIKFDIWTEEEDTVLRESVARHGHHRWSAISADIKAKSDKVRTDKQCWRRWKTLFPENETDYRRDVFIQRNALVKNFQGRKQERPKLGPQDFVSKVDSFVNPRINEKKKSEGATSGVLPAVSGIVSDPKQRRLARIQKRRIARAKRSGLFGVSETASSARDWPGGDPTDNGHEDPSQTFHLPSDNRDNSSTVTPCEARKDLAKKQSREKRRRLDKGVDSAESRISVEAPPETCDETLVESETLSVKEKMKRKSNRKTGERKEIRKESVSDLPTRQGKTANSRFKHGEGNSKKRSSSAICDDRCQTSKRRKSGTATPSTSGVVTRKSCGQQQEHTPSPDVVAFVDLVYAVRDFCKCASHVQEERPLASFQGTDNSPNVGIVTDGLSGVPRVSVVEDLLTSTLTERPSSVQSVSRTLACTDCVAIGKEGSSLGVRMVPSMGAEGGSIGNFRTTSSGHEIIMPRGEHLCNAIVEQEALGTDSSEVGKSRECGGQFSDDEVEAATKALLSWPFFYGVQRLMHDADIFLKARPSRRTPKKSVSPDAVPHAAEHGNTSKGPRRTKSTGSAQGADTPNDADFVLKARPSRRTPKKTVSSDAVPHAAEHSNTSKGPRRTKSTGSAQGADTPKVLRGKKRSGSAGRRKGYLLGTSYL